MPVFELARIVPGDLEAAWAAVVDFPSRPAHGERYRRGGLPDGADLKPGHRIELQIGRDGFTSVVTQAGRPQLLSHRADGPGFWAEYSYRLRECAEGDLGYSSEDLGDTLLTITATYGGWLGTVIARLRPGACRRYVADEMDAIISIAESVTAELV